MPQNAEAWGAARTGETRRRYALPAVPCPVCCSRNTDAQRTVLNALCTVPDAPLYCAIPPPMSRCTVPNGPSIVPIALSTALAGRQNGRPAGHQNQDADRSPLRDCAEWEDHCHGADADYVPGAIRTAAGRVPEARERGRHAGRVRELHHGVCALPSAEDCSAGAAAAVGFGGAVPAGCSPRPSLLLFGRNLRPPGPPYCFPLLRAAPWELSVPL